MRLELLWLNALARGNLGCRGSSQAARASESIGHVSHGKELVEMVLQILSGVDLGLWLASATRDGIETIIGTASANAGRAGLVAVTSRFARTTKGASTLDRRSNGTFLVPILCLAVVGTNGARTGLLEIGLAWFVGIRRVLVLCRHGCTPALQFRQAKVNVSR